MLEIKARDLTVYTCMHIMCIDMIDKFIGATYIRMYLQYENRARLSRSIFVADSSNKLIYHNACNPNYGR